MVCPRLNVNEGYRRQAKPRRLCAPLDLWLPLGRTHCERAERYRETFRGQMDAELPDQVRTAVNKGHALGDEQFRREIERLTGVRLSPRKPRTKPSAPEMTDG